MVSRTSLRLRYLKRKSLYPALAGGTIKKPKINAIKDIIDAPTIYGRKKRLYEIPELKIATISVLLANFEVNQIIEINKKIGKSMFAKYIVKLK